MKKMSPAALVVTFIGIVTAGFMVWSFIITPWMDSGLPEQGYRRPIQDQTPPKLRNDEKESPLQKSNVPPPAK